MSAHVLYVKAARTHACCSECGKLAALFRSPRSLETALGLAIARRYGTREVLAQRLTDMVASGKLERVDDVRRD